MTTAVQVQYRRGTTTQVASFTGGQGELIVDTTDNRIVVQDGSTAGGWPAAKLAEVITNARTAVTDANYTAQTTDRLIAYTAITAARSVTLPAASSFPTGTCLSIVDESGACSPTNSITVSRSGSDAIEGGSSASITIAYGYLAVQSNGAGKWTIVDQATTNLPAVSIGTPFDPNNVLSVVGASALFSGPTNFNITVNKGGSGGASADTASFVFEDGFVGYAQIGLCGDDNFHFKVYSGSAWIDALDIVNTSGLVRANIAPPAGDSSSNIATTAWFGQNYPGGFVNKFRNPDFTIGQRGINSGIPVTTSGGYTADGWIVTPSGASLSPYPATYNTNVSSSGNSGELYVPGASGCTGVTVEQRIESFDAAALAGKTVTFQIILYHNVGATITPQLETFYAASTDSWSGGGNADLSAVSLRACANGAFTQLAYTFNVSANAITGYRVVFKLNSALGASVNFQLFAADIRPTPGVATGLNSNPPPWERRPIGVEMPLNQRYYETQAIQSDFSSGLSSTSILRGYQFHTPKRSVPTIGGLSGGWQYYNSSASGVSFTPTAAATADGLTITGTSLTAAAGLYEGTWTASAEL